MEHRLVAIDPETGECSCGGWSGQGSFARHVKEVTTGHIVPEELWWTDRHNVAALLDWGDEVGEIQTVAQAVHLVEKPWVYEDMWTELRASLENDHDTLERMKGEL